MKRTVFIVLLLTTALLAIGAAALSAGSGSNTPDARQTVPAPIDGLEVVMRESAPPQVSLKITAGLPSGCAQAHSHQLTRSGNTITVTVLNSMPTGQPICTMIYGSYELTVDLGSDFAPGTTYTVQVNDKTTTFRT
jgi:hypothetical protein